MSKPTLTPDGLLGAKQLFLIEILANLKHLPAELSRLELVEGVNLDTLLEEIRPEVPVGIKGVSLHLAHKGEPSWRAWCPTTKATKSFQIKTHGYDKAYSMAVEARAVFCGFSTPMPSIKAPCITHLLTSLEQSKSVEWLEARQEGLSKLTLLNGEA